MPPGQRIDYVLELGQARCQEILQQKRQNNCIVNAIGCWEFTGSLNTDGYGQVFTKGNSTIAQGRTGPTAQTAFLLHIVAYVAAHGVAPIYHCSHTCDNRKCFNPDHLVDGTVAANNGRKGCWGDIYCPAHGHVIVSFCQHAPRCIRQPLTAQHVMCCLTMQEIATEHDSNPGLQHIFGGRAPQLLLQSSELSAGSSSVQGEGEIAQRAAGGGHRRIISDSQGEDSAFEGANVHG